MLFKAMEDENKTTSQKDSMKDHTVAPKNPDVNADSRVSRRRALLSGLVAAPAILTLMRRPVWAQQEVTDPEVSDALCLSLDAATSLHAEDQQLKAACERRRAHGTAGTPLGGTPPQKHGH